MVSEDAAVRRFETKGEAVVDGASDLLRQLLRDHPELVRARSTRMHGATGARPESDRFVEASAEEGNPGVVVRNTEPRP